MEIIMHRRTFLTIGLGMAFWGMCLGELAAQTTAGLIDGQPIPGSVFSIPRENLVALFVGEHHRAPTTAADESELQSLQRNVVCGKLRNAVVEAARERAKREIGIYATPAEVEAERKKLMAGVDPAADWKASMQRNVVLLNALSAVYDQGRDAGQVYQDMVRSHGIPQSYWEEMVYKARSRDERAKLAKTLTTPLEAVQQAMQSYDARPAVENQKLDNAIDEKIASSDPVFSRYLSELRAADADPGPRKHWMPLDHKTYLDQTRAQWWAVERGKLDVSLNDSSLISACGLAALGVTTHPR